MQTVLHCCYCCCCSSFAVDHLGCDVAVVVAAAVVVELVAVRSFARDVGDDFDDAEDAENVVVVGGAAVVAVAVSLALEWFLYFLSLHGQAFVVEKVILA